MPDSFFILKVLAFRF